LVITSVLFAVLADVSVNVFKSRRKSSLQCEIEALRRIGSIQRELARNNGHWWM